MPKILGLNVIAVLAASVAFFFVGFLWYGLLFQEQWLAAEGITAAQAEGDSPAWMIGGFLITVLQVIGIGKFLEWRGVTNIADAVISTLTMWFFLALPFVSYAFLYRPIHNSTLLMIDASHLLVGWVVSAIILKLIK